MTCKDCLHHDACKLMARKFVGDVCSMEHDDDYFGKKIAEICELYNDKSEWVHLPCKVGDTVYIASEFRGVVESKVRTLFLASNSIEMIRTEYCDVPFSNFGVTVFVTREEAEKAHEERSKQ